MERAPAAREVEAPSGREEIEAAEAPGGVPGVSAADEEGQWERTMIGSDGLVSTEEVTPPTGSGGEGRENPPLPALDELLPKIPQTSRERVDSLFRGRFTAVKRIDPGKLH